MKTFDEYLQYIDDRIKPLSINSELDLINFTKLLNNYGKVAVKFYPDNVEKIIHKYKMRGFLEFDLLEPIDQVEISNEKILFKIAQYQYEYSLVSPVDSFNSGMKRSEMFLLFSLLLDNNRQALYQLFHKIK